MRTEGESSVIITARACPVPQRLLAQALSDDKASDDDLFTQAMWRGTRAKVLARRGRSDAERLARESVELLLETDCLNLQADALVDLAQTLRLLKRREESVDVLEKAIGLYEMKGNLVSATAVAALMQDSPSVGFDHESA